MAVYFPATGSSPVARRSLVARRPQVAQHTGGILEVKGAPLLYSHVSAQADTCKHGNNGESRRSWAPAPAAPFQCICGTPLGLVEAPKKDSCMISRRSWPYAVGAPVSDRICPVYRHCTSRLLSTLSLSRHAIESHFV